MFSTTLLAGTLALTAFSSAQYLNQTAPFKLTILSAYNETLNGSSLFACHEGAAIEGICNAGQLTNLPQAATTFAFNYSDSIPAQDPKTGQDGYLTYLLQASGLNVSEPMELTMFVSSNVAHAIFMPSETGQLVAFDDQGLMNIHSYLDDTVYPPKSDGTPTALYRWFMCTTTYGSYTYETLNWVLGKFPPQNPSCQDVQIKREYL